MSYVANTKIYCDIVIDQGPMVFGTIKRISSECAGPSGCRGSLQKHTTGNCAIVVTS